MSTSVVRNRWAAGAAARLAWVSIPDPQVIEAVASSGAFDAVVTESTYGDRVHEPDDDGTRLAAIVNDEAISFRDLDARIHLVLVSSNVGDTPATYFVFRAITSLTPKATPGSN